MIPLVCSEYEAFDYGHEDLVGNTGILQNSLQERGTMELDEENTHRGT